MKISELHDLFLKSKGICTDTRKIEKDTIFFALKGGNFNGNEYAKKAIEEGCSYAVIDEPKHKQGDNFILVDDVLITLQNLANFHRKQFDIPVIGITGSNGKTTTKELIGEVLMSTYNTLITQGNLNNHLGVPFTLLRLKKEHEIAIIEMGANKPGDIKELAEIAEPTHGIITNIGTAHIEGFGSKEGVLQTKTELYRFVKHAGGEWFVNADDSILTENCSEIPVTHTYGTGESMTQGNIIELHPELEFSWNQAGSTKVIRTHLVGQYNLYNFLAAISIGTKFKVSREKIKDALENYIPSNNRSQVFKTGSNTLILDCYNANPTSMLAALENFNNIKSDGKLAILGDMLELGEISEVEHNEIAKYVENKGIHHILVGGEFLKVRSGNTSFET